MAGWLRQPVNASNLLVGEILVRIYRPRSRGPRLSSSGETAPPADGMISPGIDPDDVLMGLGGVALIAGQPEQRYQAGRLLDFLVDGLRPRDFD